MPFDPQTTRECPLQGFSGDVATATNASATVSYGAAGTGVSHGVNAITVGFLTTPAAPVTFSVNDGSNVIFSAPVAAAGAFTFMFGAGKLGTPGNAMTLTLPAGGSACVGSVSVGEHFLLNNQSVVGGMDFTNSANDVFLL